MSATSPEKSEMAHIENDTGKSIAPVTLDSRGLPDTTATGRLVMTMGEAEIEYGYALASKLQIDKDGTILWPQPLLNDPRDPLNWSSTKKFIILIIITYTTFVPDFTASISNSLVYPIAATFGTNPQEIINVSTSWAIFILGFSGILGVIFTSMFGRLPVLFWSQFIGLTFLIANGFCTTLKSFAITRLLQALFGGTSTATGLYFIKDMYFHHQQAKRVNFWAWGIVISPYLAPFVYSFLASRGNWRWGYWSASIFTGVAVILVALFVEETLYDRHLAEPVPAPVRQGFQYRLETLLGVTGWRLRKQRLTLWDSTKRPVLILLRPQAMLCYLYIAVSFGWSIGINVTLVIFLLGPAPLGFGLSSNAFSLLLLTPIVATLIGEPIGHWFNDWMEKRYIEKHHGVYEPEARLPVLYIGGLTSFVGLLALGATLQHHYSLAGIVMGWGLYIVGVVLSVSGTTNYLSDAFPNAQGEIACWTNFWRTTFGFAVTWFQIKWAEEQGAFTVFGIEAMTIGVIILIICPVLQFKGKAIRARFLPPMLHTVS